MGMLVTLDIWMWQGLSTNFLSSSSIARMSGEITIVSSALSSTTVLSQRQTRKLWQKQGRMQEIFHQVAYANRHSWERPRQFAVVSKKLSKREHRKLLSLCRTRKILSRYACLHRSVCTNSGWRLYADHRERG